MPESFMEAFGLSQEAQLAVLQTEFRNIKDLLTESRDEARQNRLVLQSINEKLVLFEPLRADVEKLKADVLQLQGANQGEVAVDHAKKTVVEWIRWGLQMGLPAVMGFVAGHFGSSHH